MVLLVSSERSYSIRVIMFKKLNINELKYLKTFYKIDWPKFVPTFGLLTHFIERFEKHPEWQEKVQFLTTNTNSLRDSGTFLMLYCNYILFFNSLEASPYQNLEKLLATVDFTEEKKFWSMEVYHGELIENLMKSKQLEKTFDERSKCTFHTFSQDELQLGVEVFTKRTEGFYYDSLKQTDVPTMTAISHYKMPSWYFENVIKHNITTGLYTNDRKLVAWTAMHEVGESGMTNADESYRRQKLASGVIVEQAGKVFPTGKVIFGHVFDKNPTAMQFFNNVGHVQIIGSHRWINLRKNNSSQKSRL